MKTKEQIIEVLKKYLVKNTHNKSNLYREKIIRASDIESIASELTEKESEVRTAEEEGNTCQTCGRNFKVDLNITDDLWNNIIPKWMNLLCGSCIMNYIENLNKHDYFFLSKIASQFQQPVIGKTAEEIVKENFRGLDEEIRDKGFIRAKGIKGKVNRASFYDGYICGMKEYRELNKNK